MSGKVVIEEEELRTRGLLQKFDEVYAGLRQSEMERQERAGDAFNFFQAAMVLRKLLHTVGLNSDPVFGVFAIFTSVLVNTWTAFEVLAGDLWECAVNAHPRGLAKLQGTLPKELAKGQKRADRAEGFRKGLAPSAEKDPSSAGKLIRLEFLEQHNYDVSAIMGSIWREERYNFQTVWGIREAYVQAFHEDAQSVRDAVLNPCFTALAAVRNVLVHKGGLVDAEFTRQVPDDARFAAVQIGKPLLIDGELVANLINPVTANSVALAETVDHWLSSHWPRVLSEQCLGRRIGDAATLEKELAAWNQQRNTQASTVKWQFTTADARVKLQRLYPTI